MNRLKLLLNAEPFGYGPTSAIADCFPELKKEFAEVSYVGSSHTLDLQLHLPYNAIHRLEGNATQMDEQFKQLVREHDIFFTALDFHNAELSIEVGIPCVVYDPLTWFWRSLPQVLSHANVLYLAQGFHGVQETLATQKEHFANAHTVPAIARRSTSDHKRTHFLINLGGLMNPFWSVSDCVTYTQIVIEAALATFPKEDLVILGNKIIEQALPQYQIITQTRQQMRATLSKTKLMLATPGLGNIYESAAHNIPTLFMPPPGDSHGQQLKALIDHDQIDAFIDWAQIDPSMEVDYYTEQSQVMETLARNIQRLSHSKLLQDRFARLIQKQCKDLSETKSSKTSQLLNLFGEDGTNRIAKLTAQFAGKRGSL